MYDYSKDKKGWVNFKSGRKKEKLRHYIADLSNKISSINKRPVNYNRDKLIFYYNRDGLKGVNNAAKVLIHEQPVKDININNSNNGTIAKP